MSILIEANLVKSLLPPRYQESHKGTYGSVGVVCGSEEMPGASRLVSRGAYGTGAGLVKSFAGRSFAPYLKHDIPEVIVKVVNESLFKTFSENFYTENKDELEKKQAIAFGCGVGQNMDLESVLRDLIVHNKKTLIIDGDGINLLQDNIEILKENKEDIIITPHPKEFSRITGFSVEEILKNSEKIVRDFSARHGIYILLKGHNTFLASPEGKLYRNKTGNSSLSKAGSGDVLTGFIAGFVAQGVAPLDSMVLSSYLHGKSGEIASENLTEYCVMASDLITYLPKAIKGLSIQGDE